MLGRMVPVFLSGDHSTNSKDWPWLWITSTAHSLDHIVQPWRLTVKEFCLWLWEAKARRLTWQRTSKMKSTLSRSPAGQDSFHLLPGNSLPCLPLRREDTEITRDLSRLSFLPSTPLPSATSGLKSVDSSLNFNDSTSPHFTLFSKPVWKSSFGMHTRGGRQLQRLV